MKKNPVEYYAHAASQRIVCLEEPFSVMAAYHFDRKYYGIRDRNPRKEKLYPAFPCEYSNQSCSCAFVSFSVQFYAAV